MKMVNSYTAIWHFMWNTWFRRHEENLDWIHSYSNSSLHILEDNIYMDHNVQYSWWEKNWELYYIFHWYNWYWTHHECDLLLAKNKPENLHPFIQDKLTYLWHVDKIKSDRKVYKLSEEWECYRIV